MQHWASWATLEELRYEDGRRTCFVPEAGKAEDLRKIRESAAERNVTLLFGAKDAERNNARALVAFVREFGGAAYAVRELTTLSRREK